MIRTICINRTIWINRTVWIPPNVISLKRNKVQHPACTAVENGRTFGDGKLFMDSIQTTVWLVPAKPNSPFLFFFFQALAFLKIHKWFYFWLQKYFKLQGLMNI